MPETHTTLKVFVASPSDVAAERQSLEDVISEFNNTWGENRKVRLELLKWETHSWPAFGEGAQDVINRQIGDTYDIFLGIMWGHFGTPTIHADSGTEEEFNRAYARFKDDPGSVQIMFYFKDAPIRPSKMDEGQMGKVKTFKKKIAHELGGLYHEFETTEEFQTKARIHLSKVVEARLSSEPAIAEPSIDTETPPADIIPHDPLANLAALENEEDEDGLFDLVEQATDSMNEVVSVVADMTAVTNKLGEDFQVRTGQMNTLSAGGKEVEASDAKRVSNNAAKDLNIFTKGISDALPKFYEKNTLAMDTFGKVAMISHEDFDNDPEGMRSLLSVVSGYRIEMEGTSSKLSEFQGITSRLPRMTSDFNRARKRAVAIMEDLLVQLRVASNQANDVEQLLGRLLP